MHDVNGAGSARRSPSAGPGGRAGGFTLIELVITIAIVAILAVIAVASYQFAVVKTRRATAQGCLLEHAQYMERWYTSNLTYAGAVDPTCSADLTPYYTVAFVGAPDANTFTLSATPILSRQNDTKCGVMTIDNTGARTSTTPAECW